MGGLSTPLRLREKALVPGRPMRAGLLTEGPPLEEDAIVRGSSTPQRNHFRWLMFHSELLALLDTAPFIHHISDAVVEPVLFYTCVAEKILCRTNSPFFSLPLWEYEHVHSLFSILPLVKLFCIYLSPRVGIIGPQGVFTLRAAIQLVFTDNTESALSVFLY